MPNRPISEILENKNPVLVEGTTSIVEVAKALSEQKQNAALIQDNGKTVGIITDADIVERVVAAGINPAETNVASVMTKNPIIIKSDRPFGQALYLMHEYGVHHIPVVDNGTPKGVVSAADALASDLQEYAHDAEMLDHIAEIL